MSHLPAVLLALMHELGWRDADGRWLFANILPLGFMLAASGVWLAYAGRRRGQESDRQIASRDLELMLLCLLLNAAALLIWEALLGEGAMLRCWAAHAVICGQINLLGHLARRPRLRWTLRPGGWAAAYSLLAGGALALSPAA